MNFDNRMDVCLVDDDPAQRRLLAARLQQQGYTIIEAENGNDALREIYQVRPRVVICDLQLPDLNGLDICRRVRADDSLDGTYFIVVTAFDAEGRKAALLNAGADDYLEKPYDLEELRARVRNGLRLSRLQERLARAATTDGLTGLANHSLFRERLALEFSRTRRYGGRVSLLMIDVDHFKAINDTYGHEIGNKILQASARHLQREVRDTDLVARYGGEEFAVLCPESGLEEATALAERLRQLWPQAVRLSSLPAITVRASIGVAGTEDQRIHSACELIAFADQALYRSKRAGRDRVTRSDSPDRAAQCSAPDLDEVDRLRKEVVSLGMQTKEICLQSVWALIQALEARDGYSAWHSRNVMHYTKWLVDAAGWSKQMRAAATNAAMLHDIGKIGIPDRLLVTPRPTDEEGASALRRVPIITCTILEPLRVFETEIQMIRHLREHWDGSGSPDGLRGPAIPIGSRLLAVAEAFDSLTCNRASRPGHRMDDAIEVIRDHSGTQFDPQFARLIEDVIARDRQRWEEQVERARVGMPARATPALVG